jgi:hypothetical protein
MAKPPQPPIADEVPLYIRWSPDRAPYSIELRLDLVTKIAAQVRLSAQLGTEVGGFLIGTFPAAHVPTIRIDDIEMVSNGSDDDTVFLPEPGELQRIPGGHSRARARESAVIGFFRTHARVGPMQPSLVDRSIVVQEFRNNPYVMLLIGARTPHTGAFFIAANGQLPQEPSVREFAFDENEFKALPEVPAEATEEESAARPPSTQVPRIEKAKLQAYAKIAALVLIAIAACVLMWSFARQATLPHWFSAGNQLHLAVAPEDHLLRISWNHAAGELNQATGATLVITDGASRSRLQLGMDDLRLGSVEYQGNSSRVDVQMILNTPGGQATGDSAEWSAQ